MWLGLYLIAFTLFGFGFINKITERIANPTKEIKEDVAFYMGAIGFWAIPLITIAYGINLIINN